MIQGNKKTLIGLLAFSAFMLIVAYVPQTLMRNAPTACTDACPSDRYISELLTYLPALIILGFAFGVGLSYLYFERRIALPESRIDRTESRIERKKAFLAMLEPTESKLVGKIADRGGEALQAELSRIEGVGKVKAHRVIERLVARGLLEKESAGKTNSVRIKKEIMDAIK